MKTPPKDVWVPNTIHCLKTMAQKNHYDEDEASWNNDGDWLREEAEREHLLVTFWDRFRSLQVRKNYGRLPRRFVMGIQGSLDDDMLVHDIALLEHGFQSGILDTIEKATLEYSAFFPVLPLMDLLRILGKLPCLSKFKVVSSHQDDVYSPFPVPALTEFFKNANEIETFQSNVVIYGEDLHFVLWAAALSKCSKLQSLTCLEQMPASPKDQDRRIYQSTKWEPVIHTICDPDRCIKELVVASGEERGMALSVETSLRLVNLKCQSESSIIDINDFTLRFLELEDVALYCSSLLETLVDVDKDLRIRFFADEATQADDVAQCLIVEKTFFRLPSFDMKIHIPHLARRRGSLKYESVIDMQLSRDLLLEPTKIHSLITARVQYLETEDVVVDLNIRDEKDLFLYRRLHEENLWDINPSHATKDEWTNLLSILGSICLGIRCGRMQYDLTPLFSFMSEQPNRVVSLVLNHETEADNINGSHKEHPERPPQTPLDTEWSLQSQLESLELDLLQFSTKEDPFQI